MSTKNLTQNPQNNNPKRRRYTRRQFLAAASAFGVGLPVLPKMDAAEVFKMSAIADKSPQPMKPGAADPIEALTQACIEANTDLMFLAITASSWRAGKISDAKFEAELKKGLNANILAWPLFKGYGVDLGDILAALHRGEL